MFEVETTAQPQGRVPIPPSDLDHILTAQLVVAWAGEAGEEPRLGWWRSDLVSEYGGEDLLRRLIPHTWSWAVLQAAREAACRKDAELRHRDSNPDQILSLYSLGFELDELLDDRLRQFKSSRLSPQQALPELAHGISSTWNRDHFQDCVRGHGAVETVGTSIGRRIKGDVPASLDLRVRRLVAALAPLLDVYPLPHFRRNP